MPNLLDRFCQWRARRRADQFREWVQSYEQARAWERTTPCPVCQYQNPQDAHFCAQCGAPMKEDDQAGQGLQTAPVAIPELPTGANLQQYLEQNKQNTGPMTIQHRAIRWPKRIQE